MRTPVKVISVYILQRALAHTPSHTYQYMQEPGSHTLVEYVVSMPYIIQSTVSPTQRCLVVCSTTRFVRILQILCQQFT